MTTYSFDDLNWMVGFFDGRFQNPNTSEFYHVVQALKERYQLATFDLDHILANLKERYQQATWKIVLVPSCQSKGVSQVMSSPYFMRSLIQCYPDFFTLYCPNENNIFQTNTLHPLFESLIYQLSDLPLLMATNGSQVYFRRVECRKDILAAYDMLEKKGYLEDNRSTNDFAYIIHLSDVHLGDKSRRETLELLYHCLDQELRHLKSNYAFKFVITGDLMDSPRRKNMYMASAFINELRSRYSADVDFILGNHDVIVSGLNMFRIQKSKVVAYLLGESVKKLDDIQVLLIKLNSSLHGNFARGMVGQRQLDEVDEELTTVENLDHYTPIVLVHHHPLPVHKADFLKLKWTERSIVGRVVEKSKTLVDGEDLLEWMKKRQVHYVLHGHKHIPSLTYRDGIYVIAAGSSTGVVRDDMDAYISYNLLQFDVRRRRIVSCTLFYEDVAQKQPKHIYTRIF